MSHQVKMVNAEWINLPDGRRVVRYETGVWVVVGAHTGIDRIRAIKGKHLANDAPKPLTFFQRVKFLCSGEGN